jgi:hypothetical protein
VKAWYRWQATASVRYCRTWQMRLNEVPNLKGTWIHSLLPGNFSFVRPTCQITTSTQRHNKPDKCPRTSTRKKSWRCRNLLAQRRRCERFGTGLCVKVIVVFHPHGMNIKWWLSWTKL